LRRKGDSFGQAVVNIVLEKERFLFHQEEVIIMKFFNHFTFILLVLGGLNWLFFALEFDLVEFVFGFSDVAVNVVYWIIGLSALYQLWYRFVSTNK
jgi:uncharacterized protein